jgi:cell division protein FtsB
METVGISEIIGFLTLLAGGIGSYVSMRSSLAVLAEKVKQLRYENERTEKHREDFETRLDEKIDKLNDKMDAITQHVFQSINFKSNR